MDETTLARKLRKSALMWLKLAAILSYRLGDIGQKVYHMYAGIVSAAFEKWVQWSYYLRT